MAVAFVNYLVCRLLPPRVLPKLDFTSGIAADCPTVVVIPVEVTGAVTVSGAVAGEPAISQQAHGVRMVTVYPSGGAFAISVAAAALAPLGCDTAPQ